MKILKPVSSREHALGRMVSFHESTFSKFVDVKEHDLTDQDGQPWETTDYKSYPRFDTIALASATIEGTLDKLFRRRQSARRFSSESIQRDTVAQILYSVFHNKRTGKRPYPSAGARYPVELYLISLRVNDLVPGVYHYGVVKHELTRLFEGRESAAQVVDCLGADAHDPAAFMIVTAVLPRTCVKYGGRGYRFAAIEAGAVSFGLDLRAREAGMDCLWLGGFDDAALSHSLGIDWDQELEAPCLALALGYSD